MLTCPALQGGDLTASSADFTKTLSKFAPVPMIVAAPTPSSGIDSDGALHNFQPDLDAERSVDHEITPECSRPLRGAPTPEYAVPSLMVRKSRPLSVENA